MSTARRFLHGPGAWRAGIAVALLALGLHGTASAGGGNVDGEVIVQLRPGAEISPLLVKYQLSLIGRFGSRPIYRLKVIGNAKVKEKIDALAREPAVRSAELNVTFEGPRPLKNLPWAIGNAQAYGHGDAQSYADQWALNAIRLAEAQRISRGAGVRIAVLDSGVDRRHPALAGRLLPGFDFVDYNDDPSEVGGDANPAFGHGTHVAGLLALVAPAARIMPLRVLDADGVGNIWVLAEAMLHAVDPDGNPGTNNGAHIINLSVGTLAKTSLFKTVAKLVTCNKQGPAIGDDDDDDYDPRSAGDKERCGGFGGAVVIAAAGNGASDKVREYPAGESSPGLLAVAASDSSGWRALFSNFGWVKFAAPGDGITSTVPGGGYAVWSGTSMAAPLAAGAAALLLAADHRLTPDKVVKRLQDRSTKLCGSDLKQLDVAAAVADESPRSKLSCTKSRP